MFILKSSDPVPLYKQLYDRIKEHILVGRLTANAKLPSVRDLAVELSVSRNTVEGAYQDLYAEGYIYSKPRCGYFVSEIDADGATLPPPRPPGKSQITRVAPTTIAYDFHPARLLDPKGFPARLWRKCFIESLNESSRDLSLYRDPQGDWDLRCSIQQYLGRSRAVTCEPERIVICAGLQHSLDIVAHLLKESHSTVAVEDPGYHLPRSVFGNHSYNIIPVPVGPNGWELDSLLNTSATIAFVTPSHQFPLGYVMPVANRLKLIEWSESGGNFIIEDDHDSELRYHGKPIPSLQGLRPDGNIIYVGTFSKVLSPALRVSYMVLPESLMPRYRSVFGGYFSMVSLLEQRTLARFMALGHWERHVRRMRTVYRTKHDSLLCSIERHFGTRAEVIGQGAGVQVVLELAGEMSGETELIERARQKGVRLFPFSRMRATDRSEPIKLLLGFGGMTADELEQGIALLSQVCS